MARPTRHRVALVPGLFGFARLAGYDYFEHIERELARRFADAGVELVRPHIVQAPPTASIRKRARVLADAIHGAGVDDDPPDAVVHLVGHSTGGLDARLLMSPTVHLPAAPPEALAWRARVRKVVTINTPHHGTPLAGFFATVSGTRLLYALSLLTFTTLRYGGPPLTVLSSLVAALAQADDVLGLEIGVLDRVTDLLLRFVGREGQTEVRRWLDGIRGDQGGILQITPESMDLFNATTEDAPGVRYGCIVTGARPPGALNFARSVRSPTSALSATIYSTLHTFAGRMHKPYPYPPVDPGDAARLRAAVADEPGAGTSDGVVPTLSQLWGELLWAGCADHLDVAGHFKDDVRGEDARHVDWLTSGSDFDRAAFGASMDALAEFLLAE